MCSVSNTELFLGGTAFNMYQGLNPIPDYLAFTATCTLHITPPQCRGRQALTKEQAQIGRTRVNTTLRVTLVHPREFLLQMCQQSSL